MRNGADDTIVENEERRGRARAGRCVSIGILTYRRLDELSRCLEAVLTAVSRPMPGSWSVAEVLVVDNDPDASARPVVSATPDATVGTAPVRYIHEPVPGVASARNRTMAEASGDVLVFIDDDEVPADGWPQGLLTVLDETGAAMVGGPVLTEFTTPPPKWVVTGEFFRRNDPKHKSRQEWLRSGNLAMDLQQIRDVGLLFDRRYRQGEDSAFTRSALAAGLDLRWSSSGAVTEFVGSDRFSIRWRLRREYLSNRAWTRSSLDLAHGRSGRMVARGRATAIAVIRAGQGVGRFAAGLFAGQRARCVEGWAAVAGAAGRIVEIMAYRRS